MDIIVPKPSFMIRRYLKLIEKLSKGGHITNLSLKISNTDENAYKLLIFGETNFPVYTDLLLSIDSAYGNNGEIYGLIIDPYSLQGDPSSLVDGNMTISTENGKLYFIDESGNNVSFIIEESARKRIPMISTKNSDRVFKGDLGEFIDAFSNELHIPTPLLYGIMYASEDVTPLVKVYQYDSGEIFVDIYSKHKHISYNIRLLYY